MSCIQSRAESIFLFVVIIVLCFQQVCTNEYKRVSIVNQSREEVDLIIRAHHCHMFSTGLITGQKRGSVSNQSPVKNR